jgi:hypothetical protein
MLDTIKGDPPAPIAEKRERRHEYPEKQKVG